MTKIEKGSVVDRGKPETLRPSGKTQAGNGSKQLGRELLGGGTTAPEPGKLYRFVGGKEVSE